MATPKQPNAVGGPAHHSILDSIITGIFGANTDEMTPAEGAKVDAQRKQSSEKAYDMATSARMNPGQQFMNGPESVGGPLDILKLVGGIAKFFGG
jgi:hypothetical protein